MSRTEFAKGLLIVAAAALVSACAGKQTMEGTEVAPAARAEVRTEQTEGSNTKIDMRVKHLAQPEKIMPGATHYVVWVLPDGMSEARNIGSLAVNEDLEAKYETTIPYENFRLMVTPESNRIATAPSGPVVLEQTIRQ